MRNRRKKCKQCGEYFNTVNKYKVFCGECYVECNRTYGRVPYHIVDEKPTKESKEPNYTNFNDLRFYNESEFEEWFKNNYVLFGISKIIDINVYFPDVLAQMFTGEVLKIELEFYAQNFMTHNHDPNGCDLIISFLGSPSMDNVRGVPVISLFYAKETRLGSTNYNPNEMILTDYFQRIVEVCLSQARKRIGLSDEF